MPRFYISNRKYAVNKYFDKAYVQQEVIRTLNDGHSHMLPMKRFGWITFIFKRKPKDDPSSSNYDSKHFLYYKNQSLLTARFFIFILFDHDQHISKKEIRQLLKYIRKNQHFFDHHNKELLINMTKRSHSIHELRSYIDSSNIPFKMVIDSIKDLKSIVKQLAKYKDSFKKLASLIQ